MRRHLNESHAGLPYSGAAESFVSFIPLFDGAPQRGDASPLVRANQSGIGGTQSSGP